MFCESRDQWRHIRPAIMKYEQPSTKSISSVCRKLNVNMPNQKETKERRNKAVVGQSTLWGVIFCTCDYKYALLIYGVV